MKKLLLLLLCVPLIGFGQERYHVSETFYGVQERQLLLKGWDTPVNGIVYSECSDTIEGKIYMEKFEVHYKDGIWHGKRKIWTCYEEDRETIAKHPRLWKDFFYIDEKQDGIQKEWEFNGDLYISDYNDGNRMFRKKINKEGKVLYEECWDEEGNEIDCD
jgi:hypothetical protein